MMSITIVHATDLTHDDRPAFEHSVALARAARGRLVSIHANAPDTAVAKMPDAADVLRRWGDEPTAVDFAKQVHSCCDEPVETLLDAIAKIEPDLVVASSHRRSALARFIVGSHAEALARNVSMPALLFPPDARNFVAETDGAIDLHRIVVPIGDAEEAVAAISAAAWLADLAGVERVEFLLLHVGSPVTVDTGPLEGRLGWAVSHRDIEKTKIEEAIIEESNRACVVVMATRGRDSVSEVFVGSHTDRVLHQSRCPVLSVRV